MSFSQENRTARTPATRDCLRGVLERAVKKLDCSDEMARMLVAPVREVAFELPLRRDDGTLSVFHGYRVQHDNSRGPFKGGLRYHADVTVEHFRDLASVMTWKTALADLPLGGAKGGVDATPAELSRHELEVLTKRYVEKMDGLVGPDIDIAAPDMGTDAQVMAWLYEAYSRRAGDEPAVVTGKPVELNGSHGRTAATGRGIGLVAHWAAEANGLPIDGARVAIQGFGNVGRHAARTLADLGARVVAIATRRGALFAGDGLDVGRLADAQDAGRDPFGADRDARDGEPLAGDELLALDVDLLVPAAIEGVIHADNAGAIRAPLIVEGANLPTTCDADALLQENGHCVVPDILANAGGVIVSYLEWVQNRQRLQWDLDRVHARLERFLAAAWENVCARARERDESYRDAAYAIGVERVRNAIELRGF